MVITVFRSIVTQPIPKPDYSTIEIQGHHIRSGDLTPFRMSHYIVTPSVKNNLKDLARFVKKMKRLLTISNYQILKF